MQTDTSQSNLHRKIQGTTLRYLNFDETQLEE